MTLLTQVLDVDLLAKHVENRYVNRKEDPRGTGYVIYDYSQHTQFDRMWDDVTTKCRGLMVDAGGNVIARPFAKFFNLSELETLPDGPFVATDKADGSLGVGYRMPDGTVAISTRGSFTSEQAEWATRWLSERPNHVAFIDAQLSLGRTPLFEIIYPENRIVVDYGDWSGLIYLTTIDIATGRDVEPTGIWPGEAVAFTDGLDIAAILAMNKPNAEGFVLQWSDGTRAKAKFPEYVRLHRLLTGVNTRHIWDLLQSGQPIDPLLELVPDEFYKWVAATVEKLTADFDEIEHAAFTELSLVPRDIPRKDQAAIITSGKYPGLVFAMLDGKPYAEKVWRMIRPEASRPFVEAEA